MTSEYITESFFDGYRPSHSLITESMNNTRRYYADSKWPTGTTVFFSHKHAELPVLDNILEYFVKKYKVIPYIDSADPTMPQTTSSETARRLKIAIKQAKKFILLATDGAIDSKWCNWELGFGDAQKYKEHIAIFPINKGYNTQSFHGEEYLGLYPYIKWEEHTDLKSYIEQKPSGLYVFDPVGSSPNNPVPLETWLNS